MDECLLEGANLEREIINKTGYLCCLPDKITIFLQKNSLQDCFELLANGAVDEEVDGGIDGKKEVISAGQAEVPGGSDQHVVTPGYINIIICPSPWVLFSLSLRTSTLRRLVRVLTRKLSHYMAQENCLT